MKPLQKSIVGISLLFAGAALLIWSSSHGISDTKASPVHMIIPGCTPAEELLALQQKSFSGDTQALDTLKKKAANNDPCAQYTLGSFYQDRKFYNEAEAAKWIESAISGYAAAGEKGNTEAQYQLGIYYWYVKRNFVEATKWFNQAANNQHSDAQFRLGTLYFGSGDKEKVNEALSLWRKAAEQGHSRAMYNLGSYYDGSFDRKPEFKKAFEWYRKSSEGNFAPSQKALSSMYGLGDGTSQNWEESYFWGCVAVKCFARETVIFQGISLGERGESFNPLEGEKYLTKETIEALKERAKNWKPAE